jgi:hypothetical protein
MRVVVHLRHLPGPSIEPVPHLRLGSEFPVKDLDRHIPLLDFVIGTPYGGEAASPEDIDETIAMGEQIPRLQSGPPCRLPLDPFLSLHGGGYGVFWGTGSAQGDHPLSGGGRVGRRVKATLQFP